jgi:hypothetical protein
VSLPALFWHSGGAVLCPRGAVSLARAREVAAFCDAQGEAAARTDDPDRTAILRLNAQALRSAVAEAEAWRRAAGWRNPDEADLLMMGARDSFRVTDTTPSRSIHGLRKETQITVLDSAVGKPNTPSADHPRQSV